MCAPRGLCVYIHIQWLCGVISSVHLKQEDYSRASSKIPKISKPPCTRLSSNSAFVWWLQNNIYESIDYLRKMNARECIWSFHRWVSGYHSINSINGICEKFGGVGMLRESSFSSVIGRECLGVEEAPRGTLRHTHTHTAWSSPITSTTLTTRFTHATQFTRFHDNVKRPQLFYLP